jgi:hypothetical protein
MMWMTGSTSCEANLHMFAEMLGYPFSGGHHVHRPNSSNKDFLYDLYTQDSSSGWHYYMSSSTLLLASSSLPGQHCFKWREPWCYLWCTGGPCCSCWWVRWRWREHILYCWCYGLYLPWDIRCDGESDFYVITSKLHGLCTFLTKQNNVRKI